jgi:hypothetical protein
MEKPKFEIEPVYLTPRQLSERTGISPQTLANERHTRRGFPYIKKGKSVLYFWPDIHTDLQSRKIVPAGA